MGLRLAQKPLKGSPIRHWNLVGSFRGVKDVLLIAVQWHVVLAGVLGPFSLSSENSF